MRRDYIHIARSMHPNAQFTSNQVFPYSTLFFLCGIIISSKMHPKDQTSAMGPYDPRACSGAM